MSNIKHYTLKVDKTTINLNVKGRINITSEVIENTVNIDIEPVSGKDLDVKVVNSKTSVQPQVVNNYFYGTQKEKEVIEHVSIGSCSSGSSVDYDKDYERQSNIRKKFYKRNAL